MGYIPINIKESVGKECKRRRTYLHCINIFLRWCKKDIRYISKKDVREFLEHLSEKDRAGSTMNVSQNIINTQSPLENLG